MTYPTVRIQPGRDKRFRAGSPWLYSNELVMDAAAKALEPGSIVRPMSENGKVMGVAHFNPHTLIAARMLTRNKDATIDAAFFRHRFERALKLRERFYDRRCYRLVHAEGDGLPGLVVDRYNNVLVAQFNTAGMQSQAGLICEVLEGLIAPAAILARNDAPIRELEGLPLEQAIMSGTAGAVTRIKENGLPFEVPLADGQKTGWYFDQRENRAFIRRMAHGADVLDLYSYSGGFGLNALDGGAASALLVDRSEQALTMARASAALQGSGERLETSQNDVFHEAAALIEAKRRFDIVIADPPPFVRSKKDLATGLKGYRKLARMSATLVREPGFLAVGCCSHNVSMTAFAEEIRSGVKAAGRGGRQIFASGASPDHPIHPGLPETAYLKFIVLALD
ncbi:MAG: class I SAM-dependent rRNA methyltransferase [Geminicoccaceae bacterium]|nr:class I SAM-dependent rRNA methyltransferase [Geminicoccaceae bacterium]